jgi:hypothetical protein
MRKTICNLSILAIALLAPGAIRAQQAATTQVVITVSDQSGALVSHAQIRLVQGEDSGAAKSVPPVGSQPQFHLCANRALSTHKNSHKKTRFCFA